CRAFPYAIKASFASGEPTYEFKSLVYKLHQKGIECLLTVYSDLFESAADICDVLRYFTETFHVDGFRLVGSNRFADWIYKDPFLKGSKLIFENPDLNMIREEGLRQYRNVSVISSEFIRQSRRFLKSDEETVSYMSYAVRENSKYYSPIRDVTDYEGFSLYDLYSYSRKHNDANNEDNKDGSNYNYSWNCGAEGETARRSVQALRLKQCKNAFLLMMLSQGTPMITAGDECLNTNFGNNNPYCQDNETGWVLYGKKKANRDFLKFTQNLIAFRKRHVILHQKSELMLFDYMSCKVPDVSFHSSLAWRIDQDPTAREFAVLYAGEYAKQYTGKEEDSVYIIYNMNWEPSRFVLPVQGDKVRWRLLYSSDGSTDDSFDESKAVLVTKDFYMAGERSISILLLKK
ncbi:MAG: glycogen operon protein GlgX, partial [Lachnospiraceae bacterium]|nr:glycogen operon protein GlgX [Lachnospiraceae bacterium]